MSDSPLSRALRQWAVCTAMIILILAAAPELQAVSAQPPPPEVAAIMSKMAAAYAAVSGYQTEMEVREYRNGNYLESKRFRYTFRKPGQLRIDMHTPKPGTVLVYPDEQGKVTLRPGGWTGFVTLHLAPGNSMLASGSGQRIDLLAGSTP